MRKHLLIFFISLIQAFLLSIGTIFLILALAQTFGKDADPVNNTVFVVSLLSPFIFAILILVLFLYFYRRNK